MSRKPNILPIKLDGVVVGKVELTDDGAYSLIFTAEGTPKVLGELVRLKQIESLTLTIDPSPGYSKADTRLGHLRVVKGL